MAVQEYMLGSVGGGCGQFSVGNMLMFVVTLLKQLQNRTFHIICIFK